MKKIFAFLLILCLCLPMVGCSTSKSTINGVKLKDYSIVYSAEDHDYSMRAAEYIQRQIKEKTGLQLPIVEDSEPTKTNYEIVVGETEREVSKNLDAETEGLQFAIFANDSQIALEGDYFIIAAAAYFFIEVYVPENNFDAEIPKEVKIHNPIVKEAKNFIMLIGDGMGEYQTRMFEYIENDIEYGDGEDLFYGSLLPYKAYSRTESLSGVTDSAAGGTALSCGIKTYNEYIGRDAELNDVQNLPELAAGKGMATAVMSTEIKTGATPAAFSAHADSRNGTAAILNSQLTSKTEYGLIVECSIGNDNYSAKEVPEMEDAIVDVLKTVSQNENGFFLMFEEAYIDKHCHKNYLDKTFNAMVRFNQAIGVFMEFAFYNPETFILITADHETGDLRPNDEGVLEYHITEHSAHPVPVFVYGHKAELFDGKEIENIQIAHTIASFMGEYSFGDQSVYTYLGK